MTKWIIRDYFAAFRWEKIKIAMRGEWWRLLYLLVLTPFIGGFYETGEYLLTYQLIIYPLVFSLFSASLHPMELAKIMFLCPVEKRVRREYVVKSCLFRMAFMALIGVLGVAVLLAGGYCDGVTACVLLFNTAVTSLLFCGFREARPAPESRPEVRSDNLNLQGGVEVADVIITLLSSIGIAFMLCWDTPVAGWVKWIFVGAAVLIQLPLTVKFMSGWKAAVERAVSYEAGYR